MSGLKLQDYFLRLGVYADLISIVTVCVKIENKYSPLIFSTLSDYHDAIQECESGLPGFISMKDKLVFCSSHDVSEEVKNFNCPTKKMMAVRNRAGNKLYLPEQFVKVCKSCLLLVLHVLF